jgi:hypothetical protein
MNDLTMTNVWLAILAIVSLIEFLMIAAAGLFAYKAYRQVMSVIDNVERAHIAPLRARVDAILDEVEVITGKVKHAQDSVTAALHSAGNVGSVLAENLRAKTWPIVGLLKSARVVAATLMQKNGKHTQPYITAGS